MATYVVGYDLHPSKGETYDELFKAIKNVGSNWWHHLDSTWVVVSEKSAVEIRDELKSHMLADDQLMVVCSSGAGAWFGFNENGSSWLKTNL
jgi:hypothetical protein